LLPARTRIGLRDPTLARIGAASPRGYQIINLDLRAAARWGVLTKRRKCPACPTGKFLMGGLPSLVVFFVLAIPQAGVLVSINHQPHTFQRCPFFVASASVIRSEACDHCSVGYELKP
jgi:hypothetical protein